MAAGHAGKSRIPATAGRVLTEEGLRAYTKCSQFHHYGGADVLPLDIRLLEWAYESLLTQMLNKPTQDRSFLISFNVNKAVHHLKLRDSLEESQVQELTARCMVQLNDVLSLLSPWFYTPLYSAWKFRTRVSKTPIDLHVSSVLFNKNTQTLNLVAFSPFRASADNKNDPVLILKSKILSQIGRRFKLKAGYVRLHIISISSTGEIIYDTFTERKAGVPAAIENTKRLIEAMEAGFHYPRLPCTIPCPFRKKCFVGE